MKLKQVALAPSFRRTLDPNTEICVTSGANHGIYAFEVGYSTYMLSRVLMLLDRDAVRVLRAGG